MSKLVGITKVDNPKHADYNKWHVTRYEQMSRGLLDPVEVLFVAETRKACRNYAVENNLDILFMDSGRVTSGCKW